MPTAIFSETVKATTIKLGTNMGSKQYGVDHLNMEINKFTVERKVYHRLNLSQFRISILVFFRVNFTGY